MKGGKEKERRERERKSAGHKRDSNATATEQENLPPLLGPGGVPEKRTSALILGS